MQLLLQDPTKVENSTVWEEASTIRGPEGAYGMRREVKVWKAAQKQAWDLVD